MKKILASLLLVFGCGGDTTGPPDDGEIPPDALPTAVGTAAGQATSGNIGAAGGTLVSADGLFTLNIPAGALSSAIDITIQPITNNAWGGAGDAYRLLPDGLTFASPVELRFAIDEQVLAETPPDFLDVAVQSGDGYWYTLKNRSFDANSRTLIATTRHFSDYSALYGLQLRPASASVGPGGVVDLEARYCFTGSEPGYLAPFGPDEVGGLVFNCDTPGVGTFTNWSVNGIAGGNNSVGQVVATGSATARYTAPANVPQSNPVAVSVRVPRRRATELLVSHITIGTGWVGTATAEFGGGEMIVASVVWKHVASFGNVEFYEVHSGTLVYSPNTNFGPNCIFVGFTPTTATIEPLHGQLLIDKSSNPPTFTGSGVTPLQATVSWSCSGVPQTEIQQFSLAWFVPDPTMPETPLASDGSITHSHGTAGNGNVKYTLSFTRGAPMGMTKDK